MGGMLELSESADYVFDAAAADRPVRFIETFCRHYEGRYAGQPFVLQPIQKQIVRDLFGWRHRETGQRRFTDCYWEAAVGAGKSPLLAALGLYGLMADGEQGAQIYSLASTYAQARIVFDTAKKFAEGEPQLSRRLEIRQYEIRHPKSGSVWRIVSGKGPGAGCRPTMILADEVHEWAGAGSYQALRDRMFKRAAPLLIAATNAGTSRASFCWRLREKATEALAGKGDAGLYPVIWQAPEDAATDDPAAWRAANPLLGVTIREEKVAQIVAGAMGDDAEEANVRRLYLSHWPKAGAGGWLDLAAWDRAAAKPFNASDLKGSPTYVGLDLSLSDDLSALTWIWATPDVMYVHAEFWLPRVTAERYELKHGTPWAQWQKDQAVHLVDVPTIDKSVRRAIAQRVIDMGKAHKVKAVCYDRYKADDTVAQLEAAGLTCVPIAQGYSVSPGCYELDRRLKAGTIVVAPNPVLRWCAENTAVKCDDRGNLWPVKPGGDAGGSRWQKIDGIAALVTAMVEARRHQFPQTQWKGKMVIL